MPGNSRRPKREDDMTHYRILAGVAAVLLLGASPAMSATQSLHVVEHATTDATAHIAAKPDNRGDVLTFTNDVFDAANKTKVGADQGFCIRVAVGKAYECLWTLSLAGGQVQ